MKNGISNYGFKKSTKEWKNNPYVRKQNKGIRKTEHRKVMEEYLGRELKSYEHIHHINENTKDNRIENLQIVTASEHGKIHQSNK